jgi:hypothetical protein
MIELSLCYAQPYENDDDDEQTKKRDEVSGLIVSCRDICSVMQ